MNVHAISCAAPAAGRAIGVGSETMNPAMPMAAGAPAASYYPPGTIGADPALRQRIETALAELGRAREERFGYAAYRAVIAGFKRDFSIASYLPWTAIWDWPVGRADEILNYLEGRYAETLGRPAGGMAWR